MVILNVLIDVCRNYVNVYLDSLILLRLIVAKNYYINITKCHIFLYVVYHRLEFHIRMRLMGHKGKIEVEPLKENAAVDLGAEMLGEVVVFSIGVAVLYAEYRRQKRGENREENKHQENFRNLQSKVEELALCVEKQNKEIEQLNKFLLKIDDKVSKRKK